MTLFVARFPRHNMAFPSKAEYLGSNAAGFEEHDVAPDFVPADHPLHPIQQALEYGCDCQVCGMWCRFPVVTPCLHLLCTGCTMPPRGSTELCSCPMCGEAFKMQSVDDPSRKDHNPRPKWRVPIEVSQEKG